MGNKEQGKKVDIQSQDLKNLDLETIKKLFDKIPKEYLDTLDLDKDSDFDEQDIEKLVN
jgi:translation initiation factor 2B subunit (eIF-2B alpha/beta/delta family)